MIQIEFPQLLRADLVLGVPESLSVEGTLFDFCRRFDVMEFKGQEDPLDEDEFVKNEVRTALFVLKTPEATFENTLNLIVSSRHPKQFFDYMKARKHRFRADKERPWQWRCRVGLQEVVVIVCRDLPLEHRYFDWLLFAPADSQKWQDFVIMMAEEDNVSLLSQIMELRPKEYKLVATKYIKRSKTDAKHRAEVFQTAVEYWGLTAEDMLANPDIKKSLRETDPKHQAELIGEVLEGVQSEEVVAELSQEQRQKLLKLLLEQEKK